MKVSRLQGNGMILSASKSFYALNVKECVLVTLVHGQINNSHTGTLFNTDWHTLRTLLCFMLYKKDSMVYYSNTVPMEC